MTNLKDLEDFNLHFLKLYGYSSFFNIPAYDGEGVYDPMISIYNNDGQKGKDFRLKEILQMTVLDMVLTLAESSSFDLLIAARPWAAYDDRKEIIEEGLKCLGIPNEGFDLWDKHKENEFLQHLEKPSIPVDAQLTVAPFEKRLVLQLVMHTLKKVQSAVEQLTFNVIKQSIVTPLNTKGWVGTAALASEGGLKSFRLSSDTNESSGDINDAIGLVNWISANTNYLDHEVVPMLKESESDKLYQEKLITLTWGVKNFIDPEKDFVERDKYFKSTALILSFDEVLEGFNVYWDTLEVMQAREDNAELKSLAVMNLRNVLYGVLDHTNQIPVDVFPTLMSFKSILNQPLNLAKERFVDSLLVKHGLVELPLDGLTLEQYHKLVGCAAKLN